MGWSHRKKITVLMLGEHGELQLSVLRCLAQSQDVEIHVLANTMNQWKPFLHSRYIKSYRRYRIENQAQLKEAIRKEIERTKAEVLIGAKEDIIGFIAQNADHLRSMIAVPPTPEPATLELVRDKWKLARWLEKQGLVFPATVLCPGTAGHNGDLKSLEFPVIIKPRSEFGGRKIKSFQNYAALCGYLDRNLTTGDQYVIQEYIDGYDIDCSVLCRDGDVLAHTIQTGTVLRNFAYSTGIKMVGDAKLYEFVKDMISRMAYSGIAHLDFRYDRRQECYKLIDFNPRYWNTLLGSLAAGINFPILSCLSALNRRIPNLPYQKIDYYLWKTALKEILRYLLGLRGRVGLKQTEFIYILRDPLPEMVNMAMLIRSLFKRGVDMVSMLRAICTGKNNFAG
jgi:predicted ATP-grasp superfamily ATP-dependent carboligase